MDLPIYSTVIFKLLTQIDLLLQNYVYNGYQSMADMLREPLGIAATLYIGLMGYGISQGKIKIAMPVFISSSIKLAIIYVFAMNWGHFSDIIVTLFQNGAEELGNTLLQATPINLPDFAGGGINGAMQSVLIAFTKIGSWSWEQGSFRNVGPYFTSLIIWGFGYILVAFTLFQIIVAKIMMAILFCLAPLFFCFTLFKPTQSFFDRWLGALASYSFLLIIISAVTGLAMNIAYWSVADHYLNEATDLSLVGFTPVIIVCLVCIGLVKRVTSISDSIGGSITSTSGASMLSENIGSALKGGAMAMSAGLGAGLKAASLAAKGLSVTGKLGKAAGKGSLAIARRNRQSSGSKS